MTQPTKPQKWRIEHIRVGAKRWAVRHPEGEPSEYFDTQPAALEYVQTQQREALEQQLKDNPGAALALLLIAGLAAAAQNQEPK